MKFMYFVTLLLVALCASLNIPGMLLGKWYSYVSFIFISISFMATLIIGIIKWREL